MTFTGQTEAHRHTEAASPTTQRQPSLPPHILELDPASPLLFVVNSASGHTDPAALRQVIETALEQAGRKGEVLLTGSDQIASVAQQAAARAVSDRSAIVAVGGDGTINSVAQAAHAQGCAMGVMPQGTFNYFARTHGIPADPAEAAGVLLRSTPTPVQVGTVNEHVFLVNASLGLYPELLEDRETYKARFGRSRLVAFGAAVATVFGKHRQLRLEIEFGSGKRAVKTLTLFVGNNRLQLEQVGVQEAGGLEDDGSITAVILRPVGPFALLWLMLRGAMGTLGDASTVESFKFHRMVVKPRLGWSGRKAKVAFDGEVDRMHAPLVFRVSPEPLYLLKPSPDAGAVPAAAGST